LIHTVPLVASAHQNTPHNQPAQPIQDISIVAEIVTFHFDFIITIVPSVFGFENVKLFVATFIDV